MITEEPVGNGYATYSDEGGKLQMVGYRVAREHKTQFRRLLELRRLLRSNERAGMTIKRSTYGLGWNIGHTSTQWTLWTVYLDQHYGFTLFEAHPDIDKGIDIEDERLIIQTDSLWALELSFTCNWYRLFPHSTL